MMLSEHDTAIHSERSIAVAMTTFNGAAFLESQMASILSQTILPVAIMICDDRSTDHTVDVLRKFTTDEKVRVVVNPERLGVIENFKKAVSLAPDVNYIALSDQDDVWMPDKLERLLDKIRELDKYGQPAMVYTDLQVIDENGRQLNPSFWNELGHDGYRHCFETLLFGNFVTGCTILMNRKMRDLFVQMPSDISMHDAWVALIAFSFGKAGVINAPLVQYRRHQNNVAFVKEHPKKGKLGRMMMHVQQLFGGNDFLNGQFALVKKFATFFEKELSADHLRLINDFLLLKNESYYRKKSIMWKWFKPFRYH